MLALSRFLFTSSVISTTLAATINVKVGADGLAFTPNQITANQGDEIVFEFHPKNHTLTQSTLAQPCTQVAGGGNSGYMPVAVGSTTFPTKRLIVPDATTPLWFYCAQGNHCQSGMVFAVNPGTQAKMDTFLANAKAFTPGGASTPPPAPTSSSTPPPPAPSDTATASSSDQPPASTPGPSGSTTGKTINIAVGQGGLTFTPDRATAAIGDQVVFTFMAGSHTVTQSTFADPCTLSPGGVDSGPKPAAGLSTGFPTFTYNVTDIAKPAWFFCKTGNHCRAGMVFSLNAPATGNTADAFKAAAMSGTSGPVSNSTGTTSGGPQSTGTPGDGAGSRFAGGLSGLVLAAMLAGLLL